MMRRILSNWLPESASGRSFALVALIDALGTGFFIAGSAVFFVRFMGLSAAQVGLGLGIANAIGMATTLPIGMLADRLGAKKALIALHLWRAVWFALLAFSSNWWAFLVTSTMIAIADRSVSPVTRSVVGSAVEDCDRVRTLAAMRSIRNVGFSAGAALTAPLLAIGQPWAFRAIVLADASSFVLAAALLQRLRVEAGPSSIVRKTLQFPRGLHDWPYVRLAGLDGVLALHSSVLAVALPIWVVQHTQAPAGLVPVLVLVNTIMAVVLQVPFSAGAEAPGGGMRAAQRGGVALGVFCLAVAFTPKLPSGVAAGVLIACAAVLTFAELWQSVGSWEMSHRYADPERRTEYLSVFSLGVAAQEVLGPLLLTTTVLSKDGPLWWMAFGIAFVAVAVAVRWAAAPLEARQARSENHPSVTTETRLQTMMQLSGVPEAE